MTKPFFTTEDVYRTVDELARGGGNPVILLTHANSRVLPLQEEVERLKAAANNQATTHQVLRNERDEARDEIELKQALLEIRAAVIERLRAEVADLQFELKERTARELAAQNYSGVVNKESARLRESVASLQGALEKVVSHLKGQITSRPEKVRQPDGTIKTERLPTSCGKALEIARAALAKGEGK